MKDRLVIWVYVWYNVLKYEIKIIIRSFSFNVDLIIINRYLGEIVGSSLYFKMRICFFFGLFEVY